MNLLTPINRFGIDLLPKHVEFTLHCNEVKSYLEQMLFSLTGKPVSLEVDFDEEESEILRVSLSEEVSDSLIGSLKATGFSPSDIPEFTTELMERFFSTGVETRVSGIDSPDDFFVYVTADVNQYLELAHRCRSGLRC